MTIRTRLVLGLLAIAAVLLIPLLLALRSLEDVDDDVSALQDKEMAALVLLRRSNELLEEFAIRDRQASTAPGAGNQPSATATLDTAKIAAMAIILRGYEFDSLAAHLEEVVQRSAAGADPDPAIAAARRTMEAVEREVSARASAIVQSAAAETARARDVAVVALGVATLLAIAIGTWLTVSIGRPVAALKEGMLGVAEGDFSHPLRIEPSRRDEFGVLAESFATMTTRLAQLERMKAVWTSIITHELKTPINVILGNVQLGEEGILGELTPKQRTAFATMRRNATVLKGRVQRLLDVSQFEAGAGRLELTSFRLADFLDGVEASFAVIGQERKVDFHATRSDDLPEQVVWDQDRVNEILDNLLSNAFKFTPAGGRVELRAESAGPMVRLEVRDTGAGIPESQLPHLFRRFYQADNQKSASAKGTGLGLAISKEIAEAHGGTIDVRSAVGTGTTFTVTMPAVVARGTEQGRATTAASISSSPSNTSSAPSRDSAPRP